MGTWGTAISSNDTFADTYYDFFTLYNDGFEVPEITQQLIDQNQETLNIPEDANNFWLAIAKCQWECKQLDPQILNRIKEIIDADADILIWKELGADIKTLKKRREHLDKFLAQIQTERTKPKVRKKKIIREPIFEKGDCLIFKLNNGNFGGAFVLEAIKGTEYNYNLIASTRINKVKQPTEKDFKDADILVKNYSNRKDDVNIMWYLPIDHKNLPKIDILYNLEVNNSFDPNKTQFGFVNNFTMWFIETIDEQFKHEQISHQPSIKIPAKKFIKKDFFKFW
ncbi:hypothetical protein OGH69_04175 [Flavobacterium sp. MFBS3-15]|uniref:hypothetical protein n=1 Tax=Flavobacterium sp. MFBS3-15 TaxID=2989816 RepID=UPI0022358518|nr:hypothetical protein [Flavobacterium sp. MFBS3-15]MCW4468153.1 hypothetical protein [Flavobacterium sp. MFBS3-15]